MQRNQSSVERCARRGCGAAAAATSLCLFAGSAFGQWMFQRAIDATVDERAYSIEQNTDGGYITAGVRTTTFGAQDIHVCRYTADGRSHHEKITFQAGPRGQFVFTGARPTSVAVTILPGSIPATFAERAMTSDPSSTESASSALSSPTPRLSFAPSPKRRSTPKRRPKPVTAIPSWKSV